MVTQLEKKNVVSRPYFSSWFNIQYFWLTEIFESGIKGCLLIFIPKNGGLFKFFYATVHCTAFLKYFALNSVSWNNINLFKQQWYLNTPTFHILFIQHSILFISLFSFLINKLSYYSYAIGIFGWNKRWWFYTI